MVLNKDSSEQLLAASECCYCAAQKLSSKTGDNLFYKNTKESDFIRIF